MPGSESDSDSVSAESTPLEEADRRLESGSFSSGLTVPDFAACLQMGLRPVGLVQGFCVMQWGWYSAGSQYLRGANPFSPGGGPGVYSASWRCPHGMVSAEHRAWGQNYEQPWVESAWAQGFGSAYERMLEEARFAKAHGVIGIVDRTTSLSDMGVTEFHILGTAVVVEDGPPPADGVPWTTYLAGQRLAKLVESGFMPVAVTAALASVRVWAYCITEYQMRGGTSAWGAGMGAGYGVQEVDQISEAHAAVRSIARAHVRRGLQGDWLHGARMDVSMQRVDEGDEVLECTLRGTRVRRFRQADPLPAPRPTVRLG